MLGHRVAAPSRVGTFLRSFGCGHARQLDAVGRGPAGRRIAVGLCSALVIVVTAVLAFFLGATHAMDGLSIKRVTATEIANAMQDDRFFTDYGQSTLLVDGTSRR
ncbi:MAG: hypothetical protein M3R49_01975 [Chloroflexota bacterium]|nr:hypothetical protein [Chloroflexota bacterium]